MKSFAKKTVEFAVRPFLNVVVLSASCASYSLHKNYVNHRCYVLYGVCHDCHQNVIEIC